MSRGVYVTVALALLTFAAPASAQIIDIPAMVLPDRAAPPTALSLQYGHQFATDVDDGSEISRNNVLLMGTRRFDVSEKTQIVALGTYTLHGYDFSSNSSSNYQWDDVHRAVLSGVVGHQMADGWRVIGGGLIRSWGEGGADFGDSITGGVIAGFDYQSSETLTVGLLVGIFSRLEDSMSFLPVPVVRWQFADDWRWDLGMVSVMDPGIGSSLSWKATKTIEVGAGFTFQNREFRLRDKDRTRGSDRGRSDDGGLGRETEIPIFASLRWRPVPTMFLDVQGGVALNGNVRVEDKSGRRISNDDYDPAGLLSIKGTIAF